MYFLAINRIKPGAATSDFGKVMSAHIEWTKRQIEAGTIVQAGKWGDSGGMAIIKAGDDSAAEDLLRDDPLVSSGLVVTETARFYPDVPIE